MRAKCMKTGGAESLNKIKNLRPRSKITGSLQTVCISSCDVYTTSIRPVTDLWDCQMYIQMYDLVCLI